MTSAMTVRAAALYARISSDQDGTALGVTRQLEDCRRLAADLGWPVASEYVDNDVSAYSGKRRPEYSRLLADLADGMLDAVVVYHPDRLSRIPAEVEHFLDVLKLAKVRHVQFVSTGGIDIGNGDGLLVLRILAAVAANESATKSRRVKRKMDQRAELGLPHGGHFRPFGYENDKMTVRKDEAQVIRALAERFLAGESLRSLAMWLDAQHVRTVAGGPWRTTTVRAMLSSGRIAGLRDHRGQVIGKARWRPIISAPQHSRIRSRLVELRVTGRRAPRSYLLSGSLRCGKCGNTLFSAAREWTRRYVCLSGPDHGGCGRLTVVASPLEELVAEMVLIRLDTPALADALAGRIENDERSAALSDALVDDRNQLDELAHLYAAKQIPAREWLTARKPIEDRIHATERTLARLARSDALAGLVGNGQQLRSTWTQLNLTRQHAIVAAILDHAVIASGTPGSRSFDPGRVDPHWRL
jgi:site-specific DNA recombinase